MSMTNIRHPLRLIAALLLTVLALGGCSSIEPVAAWERGYLADEAMLFAANPREMRLKGHVYASKEASSGGAGAAGGGCGCN